MNSPGNHNLVHNALLDSLTANKISLTLKLTCTFYR